MKNIMKRFECSECGIRFNPANIGYVMPYLRDERGEFCFCCNACWMSWIMSMSDELQSGEDWDEDEKKDIFLESPETILFKRFLAKKKDFGKFLDILRDDMKRSRKLHPLFKHFN